MRKIIFEILGVIGIITISILAFVIPKNPFEVLPAVSIMGFDKPLWLAIIITGGFFYIVILASIYDYLKKKQCVNKN